MYEFTPRVRKYTGLAAVAMLLAGCGEQPAYPVKGQKEKHRIMYTDGMRIDASPSRTIIDLCRGNTLLHAVIIAYIHDDKALNKINIKSSGPDPKCADGTILPNDFGNTAPTETGATA